MTENVFELTLAKHTRRIGRAGECICHKCRKELKVGDTIVSKPSTLRWPSSIYKWYCVGCAVDLFLVEVGVLVK